MDPKLSMRFAKQQEKISSGETAWQEAESPACRQQRLSSITSAKVENPGAGNELSRRLSQQRCSTGTPLDFGIKTISEDAPRDEEDRTDSEEAVSEEVAGDEAFGEQTPGKEAPGEEAPDKEAPGKEAVVPETPPKAVRPVTPKAVTAKAVTPKAVTAKAVLPGTVSFESEDGVCHDIRFTHRPLGIHFQRTDAGRTVNLVEERSYAEVLGVKVGWTMVAVEGSDLRGLPLSEAHGKFGKAVGGLPVQA